MKHSLLLLTLVAAVLCLGAPAYAQKMFLDVDGDGLCTTADVITSSTATLDVWVDTDEGGTKTCSDGVNPLNINSYIVNVIVSGTGSVSFGAFQNLLAGITTDLADDHTATEATVIKAGSTYSVPGKYHVGYWPITATGDPQVDIEATSGISGHEFDTTGFGSKCTDLDGGNTQQLGRDWFSVCGTTAGTPVTTTTWGAIKNLYR